MAKKAKLAFTLSLLQTLSLALLTAIYQEVAGEVPQPEIDTPEKLLGELLKVAVPAPEPEAVIASVANGLPEFTHKRTKYRVLIPKVEIPGIGVRSAAELAVDETAIDHLIKIGCVGSVFEEI